jgi:hypothetical protein
MQRAARPGAVIFTANKERLTTFYQAVTGLPVVASDGSVSVLASEHFELVIHALPGEMPGRSSARREDVYVKPFFQVESLADARRHAESLGGARWLPRRRSGKRGDSVPARLWILMGM